MNSSAHQQEQTEQSLSSAEARLRLARDGYNELPSAIRRDTLAIALSVAREPMFLLLIASAVFISSSAMCASRWFYRSRW